MDCKILRQYSLIIDPSIETKKKKIDFSKVLDKETPLSERSCCEWFQKLKNGEFHIEDKERSGGPKVYEGAELEALLDQDSCQTQEE